MSEAKRYDLPWTCEVLPGRVVVTLGPPEVPSTDDFSLVLFGGDDEDIDKLTVEKADFLVRACNSHAALVAVAEEYLKHLWDCYHSGMSQEAFDAHPDVVEVRAALAAARK